MDEEVGEHVEQNRKHGSVETGSKREVWGTTQRLVDIVKLENWGLRWVFLVENLAEDRETFMD